MLNLYGSNLSLYGANILAKPVKKSKASKKEIKEVIN